MGANSGGSDWETRAALAAGRGGCGQPGRAGPHGSMEAEAPGARIASCHNNLLLSSPPDRWFELAKRPALIFTLRAAPPISILIDSDTGKRWAGRGGGEDQGSREWAGQVYRGPTGGRL